ncbi:biotin carboxylase [Desulfobotulus alkaliphilus]|uniref:Biotin carboxylase n=1 Tax=Desulfobotulus alkaliphilus TaxID=622671 RepID=A0A562RT60_9BACT|nr:methyltransferase domain-containing protein [Desulfobotulus alkaliphilus]TWI72277.1 biotin carboxylase [Desulfobotulus alkaliphilus]
MEKQVQHVIIVDGFSTGTFYPPLLRERGIPAVHVRSGTVVPDGQFGKVVEELLSRVSRDYAAMLEEGPDLDGLVRNLSAFTPCAVLAGCETGVELGDLLAARLSLSGNDPASSATRRNKYEMHQALARAGLRHLSSLLTDSLDALLGWIREGDRLPVVLKPTSSAGADGIHVCKTLEEVRKAFHVLMGAYDFFGRKLGLVLAQEFAPGVEVVVNTVSCQGRHRVSDLWRYSKMITPEGRSVYDGGGLVADFGEDTERVLKYAFAALDALNIRFGPAHSEIMITPSGPVLIECGARPMGASFPQDLLRESVGHTQLELALQAVLDPEVFMAQLNTPYVLRKHFFIKNLVSNRQGGLDATPAVTLLSGLPSVRSGNFLHCLESGHVEQTVDLLTSPATLFLCHENPDVLREDHELITSLEEEGQNLLFELTSMDGAHPDPDWFQRIPDELWLRPESEGEVDADTVWKALGLLPGQEVLDCPCGDARFGQNLARRGVRYTGVDINPRFIDRARQRFSGLGLEGSLSVGDMRSLGFENCFDAVINWFNSFGYFDVETDFLVLKNLAAALRPGGLLLIEAPSRSNIIVNTTPKFDSDGKELERRWDEISERMFLPVPVTEEGRIVHVLTGPRLYSISQYKLLFRLAGLTFVTVYDEKLGPFTDTSRRMILLARKN